MNKDEALKLALEVLENLLYWDNGKPEYDEAREAITAIKQALAAPVQEPDSECNPYDLCAGCRCKFSAAQPAPVQEPVAEVIQADTENYKIHIIKPQPAGTKLYTAPPAAQPAPVQEALLPAGLPTPDELEALSDGNDGMLLDAPFLYKLDLLASWMRKYTTPPAAQRQWVGLTDEDVKEIREQCDSIVTLHAIKAIEAKLKEKNT